MLTRPSSVPDPLTGRTGAEEALHCLQSGYCQPWTPLGPSPLNSLMSDCRPHSEKGILSTRHENHAAGLLESSFDYHNPA